MNPYNNNLLGNEEFLGTVYILMLKKIKRLIEIEDKRRVNLSLLLLKEKMEIASKFLEAISHLINMIDFENKDGVELADILNDIGILLGKANISDKKEDILYGYNMVELIIRALLKNPDEEGII